MPRSPALSADTIAYHRGGSGGASPKGSVVTWEHHELPLLKLLRLIVATPDSLLPSEAARKLRQQANRVCDSNQCRPDESCCTPAAPKRLGRSVGHADITDRTLGSGISGAVRTVSAKLDGDV